MQILITVMVERFDGICLLGEPSSVSLLSKNASISPKSWHGHDVFHYAVIGKNPAILRLLYQRYPEEYKKLHLKKDFFTKDAFDVVECIERSQSLENSLQKKPGEKRKNKI